MIGKRYVDIHTALIVLLASTSLGMDGNYSEASITVGCVIAAGFYLLFFFFFFIF